jgi:hypothetical protein
VGFKVTDLPSFFARRVFRLDRGVCRSRVGLPFVHGNQPSSWRRLNCLRTAIRESQAINKLLLTLRGSRHSRIPARSRLV